MNRQEAIDVCLRLRWLAINRTVPLNPNAAIYKRWRDQSQEWGSPLEAELVADDGVAVQAFSNAVVTYHPDGTFIVIGSA